MGFPGPLLPSLSSHLAHRAVLGVWPDRQLPMTCHYNLAPLSLKTPPFTVEIKMAGGGHPSPRVGDDFQVGVIRVRRGQSGPSFA